MDKINKVDSISERIWAFDYGDSDAALALALELRDKEQLTFEQLETILSRGGPGTEAKWHKAIEDLEE
jgi:hypothetical protein